MIDINRSDDLYAYRLRDDSTLMWSSVDECFIYLNQIASWIQASRDIGHTDEAISTLLQDELQISASETKELLEDNAALNSMLLSEMESEDIANDTPQASIPFNTFNPDRLPSKRIWKTMYINAGGVSIKFNVYGNVFDINLVTSPFKHLIELSSHNMQDRNGDPENHTLEFGTLLNGHYWALCAATGGYIATTREELCTLVYWMVYKTIETRKCWLVALHAGGVIINNRAIIVTGPSGSGKSTLVANLMSTSGTYLSDELITITKSKHLIIPVPTSLCAKEGSWKSLNSVFPSLEKTKSFNRLGKKVKFVDIEKGIEFRNTISADQAIVLFPKYSESDSGSLRSINAGEILERLLNSGGLFNGFNTKEDFNDFSSWIDTVDGYDIRYNSSTQALALIDALINTGNAGY